MTIHNELSRRSDELWEQWEGLGATVNSTIDVLRIARRELMAKYIAQGKPDVLIPLLDWNRSDADIAEIDTVAMALAERRKFDAACKLWEQTLSTMEKQYWSGLREFRRRYPDGDPDGERVNFYERDRSLLCLAYGCYHNLIVIYGGRSQGKLEKAVRQRRRLVFSEKLPGKPAKPDSRSMTESVFWELIESVGKSKKATDDRVEALGERLKAFRPKEIRQFGKLVRGRLKDANTWPLWGAAYLLNGGSSDDGFLYFRGWLILQGRTRFTDAVRDADSIAGWARPNADDPAECEVLIYLADEVYEKVTGDESIGADGSDGNPKGKRWKEKDLPTLLPKLWKVVQR